MTDLKTTQRKLIVAFTSYPPRFFCLEKVINSLLLQTKKADKIVLYLYEGEVPEKEKGFSTGLKKQLAQNKFEIRWVKENLKPHKRYFYAFQDFPNDLIVTIDDDIAYPQNLLKVLYTSYLKHPNYVSACRVHTIATDKQKILQYRYWLYEDDLHKNIPSHRLFATGVGGVLYPAYLFDKTLLNIQMIRETCLNADDLYLKFLEIANNIPVILVEDLVKLNFISKSQNVGLCYINNGTQQLNDVQFQNICTYAKEKLGIDITEKILASNPEWAESITLYERINKLKREIAVIKKSNSYLIGKAFTYLPRKAKKILEKILTGKQK